MNGSLRNIVRICVLRNWNAVVWTWGVFCLVADPVFRIFRDGHEDPFVENMIFPHVMMR